MMAGENFYLDLLVDKILKQALACFGIFINSIAIWILVSNKKMQNMFLHFLACSLIADNGYLLMALLTTLYWEFKVNSSLFFNGMVGYITIPFKEVFYTANVLITISLAYERFSTIHYSSGHRASMAIARFRYQRLKKYVLVISLFSFIFNITEFMQYDIPGKIEVCLESNGTSTNCTETNNVKLKPTELNKDASYRIYLETKWLIFLSVSFIILTALNFKIFLHVKKTLDMKANITKLSNDAEKKDAASGNGSNSGSKWRLVRFLERLRKQEKVTFALFALVILFFFCNIPYVIDEILKAGSETRKTYFQKNFEIISRVMRVVNSCSNVLVYCVADRRFRGYLKMYLTRIPYLMSCKKLSLLKPEEGSEVKEITTTQAQYPALLGTPVKSTPTSKITQPNLNPYPTNTSTNTSTRTPSN